MEFSSYHNREIAIHTLRQLAKACDMLISWNVDVKSVDDYMSSPLGVQLMAASCMLLESIGEGVKKVDKVLPDFLSLNAPEIPWRSVMGLRDHIAHGYFNLDAEIIYDVVVNELPVLQGTLDRLISVLTQTSAE